jgi:hypothetical protein
MQQVNRGSGWSYEHWAYSVWSPVSSVWMNKPNATLLFNVAPSAAPYRLSAHVLEVWEGARDTLKIGVNGIDVPVHWDSPHDFSADIPSGVVKAGTNVLALDTAPSTLNFGVSLRFDWIVLSPTKP